MGTVVQKVASLFRLGRLPAALRSQLETEAKVLHLAEGIWETAVFKDFRAPGNYCLWRSIGFTGFFVLTEKRMMAKARFYHYINVNVTYDDPRFRSITFSARPKMLSLAFDASLEDPEWSGQLEVHLHLPDVGTVAQILQRAGAQIELKVR